MEERLRKKVKKMDFYTNIWFSEGFIFEKTRFTRETGFYFLGRSAFVLERSVLRGIMTFNSQIGNCLGPVMCDMITNKKKALFFG